MKSTYEPARPMCRNNFLELIRTSVCVRPKASGYGKILHCSTRIYAAKDPIRSWAWETETNRGRRRRRRIVSIPEDAPGTRSRSLESGEAEDGHLGEKSSVLYVHLDCLEHSLSPKECTRNGSQSYCSHDVVPLHASLRMVYVQ
jgi:hypothetical protein